MKEKGLFMLKKRRKSEVIEITIPEIVKEKNNINDLNSLYCEKVIEKKEEYSLTNCHSLESKLKVINYDFNNFGIKRAEILQWYYIFRLFSVAVKKDDQYNNAKICLDKDINSLKRNYEDINRKVKKINTDQEASDSRCEDIYSSINNLYAFGKDIIKREEDFRKKYYGDLKVSSITIVKEKTYEELEKLNDSIDKIIIEYGSVEKAKDYFYYNSGQLISEVIDQFVNCISYTNNEKTIDKYNYHYFLEQDFALTLTINEWINLFNKLRFVYKHLQNVNEIELLKLNRKYKELENRYIILLLANEIESKRINGK